MWDLSRQIDEAAFGEFDITGGHLCHKAVLASAEAAGTTVEVSMIGSAPSYAPETTVPRLVLDPCIGDCEMTTADARLLAAALVEAADTLERLA